MSKADIKKQHAVERIATHLFAEGLNQTGLRRLAQAAGTSDRMLIYYFGSKEALLDEVLGFISAGLIAQLDALLGTKPRPAGQLLEELTALGGNEAFMPSVQLWFELVGLAARGEEPYLSNARTLADNWITWIASRIDASETFDPQDLYAHLEGRMMLKLIQTSVD